MYLNACGDEKDLYDFSDNQMRGKMSTEEIYGPFKL